MKNFNQTIFLNFDSKAFDFYKESILNLSNHTFCKNKLPSKAKKFIFTVLIILGFNNFIFAQWVKTNLPNGGTITSIAVAGNNVFAVGSEGSGLFKSVNEGITWTQVNTGLANLRPSSIVVKGSNIFIGTSFNGVFISNLNGDNWVPINNGLTDQVVFSLAVKDNFIFAGTQTGGIFRSNNNGLTWTSVNSGLPPNNKIESLVIFGNRVYAGISRSATTGILDNGGVYFSNNDGDSWTSGNNSILVNANGVEALTVNSKGIFVGTQGGLFKSIDEGNNWISINNGFPPSQIRYLATSGNNVFVGSFNFGVYLTSNSGATWASINDGLTANRIKTLAISNNYIFAGSEGIIETEGVGLWKRLLSDFGVPCNICDTKAWNTPFGDCASGHTNTDLIEWPSANIEVQQSAGYLPDDLANNPNIHANDVRPRVFGSANCDVILSYGDIIQTQNTGFRVLRQWTCLIASTGVMVNYEQTINVIKQPSLIYPNIILSSGTIALGQNLVFTGSKFKANSLATLTIQGPNGYIKTVNNISTNAQGGFSYTFASLVSMTAGKYYITAKDNSTGKTTSSKPFMINTAVIELTSRLKITYMNEPFSAFINQEIVLEVFDFIEKGSSYPESGSRRYFKYRTELSSDGGNSWMKIGASTEGTHEKGQPIRFRIFPKISSLGSNFKIRVVDDYKPSIFASTGLINVREDPNKVIKVEMKWDYSYPLPFSGPSPNPIKINGIAADGVARVYLDVSKINPAVGPSITSVSVKLSDGKNDEDPAKLGKVKIASLQPYKNETYSSEANGIRTISEADNMPGKSNYIFWYVAPDDFIGLDPDDYNSSERIVKATFTIKFSDGNEGTIHPYEITIVRPPLMLVHGLGSGPSTWDNFQHTGSVFLKDFRFNATAVKIDPGAKFIDNAFKLINGNTSDDFSNSFAGVLTKMRLMGIVSNRVDYIGHSMGGNVLRSALTLSNLYYRTGNQSNRPYKNYEQGYVNKFISIGTPHNGSPWADLLKKYDDDLLEYLKPLLIPLHVRDPHNIIFSYFQADKLARLIPAYKLSDAVTNLQIDNSEGGIQFPTSNLKAHLIASDIIPGDQSVVDLSISPDIISGINGWADKLGWVSKLAEFVIFIEPNGSQLRKNLMEINGNALSPLIRSLEILEKLTDAWNVGTFIPESDLVVPVNSQIAASRKNKPLPTNVSIFENWNAHCCLNGETQSLFIGNKVYELLNSPINSDAFKSIPATPNFITNNILASRIVNNPFDILLDKSRLEILQPSTLSNVFVDSTLMVKINVPDTTSLLSLELRFQGKTYILKNKVVNPDLFGNTDILIDVNPDLLDVQQMVLEGFYIHPDRYEILYDTVSLKVTPNNTLLQFEVNPEVVHISIGETFYPEYFAIFENFITSTGNFSTDILSIVDDPNKLVINSSGGGFTGKNVGETFAIIEYKGLKDTIYFIVESQVYNSACTTPGTPTNISAIVSDDNITLLTWSPGDPTGSPNVRYNWVVGTDSTVTNGNGISQGTTSNTGVSTNLIPPGGTYYLRVQAYTDCDNSTSEYETSAVFQTVPCTTPGAPVNVQALVTGKKSATLSWQPGNPKGAPTLLYYWVIGTSPLVSYGNGVTQGITYSTNAVTSDLLAGTTYYLRVYATSDCNDILSPYGTSAAFTTNRNDNCITPGTPVNVHAIQTSPNTANLSWTSGALSGSPAITYFWVIGTNPGVTYGNGVDQGFSSGNSATTSSLSCNMTYYLRVYAATNCDNSISDYGTSLAFTTSDCSCITPGTPVGVNVIPTGQNTANLSWVSGSPSGSAAITYFWVIGTSPNVTYGSGVDQGFSNGTSATTSSLSCNTTYFLRVYAGTNCDNSISGYGTSTAFSTMACSCSTPGTPVNLNAAATGLNAANLSWNAGNPPGSPTVTYYWVVGSSNFVTLGNGVAQGSTTGFGATATGLLPGTTYYLRVYARTSCNGSVSGYGTSYAFTTNNAGCVTPSVQSSTITFSLVSTQQFTANWFNGNGSRRVVKINTVNNFSPPVNGTDPLANSKYVGNGDQVIYNGNGNSVTITGLYPNTTYWIRVYEANCSGSNSFYNTSQGTNNPISQRTRTVLPSVQSFSASNVTFNGNNIVDINPIFFTNQPYAIHPPIDIFLQGNNKTRFTLNASYAEGFSFQLVDQLTIVTDGTMAISPPTYGRLSPVISTSVNSMYMDYTHPEYVNVNPYLSLKIRLLFEGGLVGMDIPVHIHAPQGALPVELIDFRAQYNKHADINELSWITKSEVNNDYFDIERSFESFSFENIGRVAGSGNSTTTIDYVFNDKNISQDGNYTYRLKQVDLNGRETFSKPASVNIFRSKSIKTGLFPNPASDLINFFVEAHEGAIVNIDIFNSLGQKVSRNANSEIIGNMGLIRQIDSKDFGKGIFTVVFSIDGIRYNHKLIIID